MRRRLTNVAAFVLFALLIGAAVVWVRSYAVCTRITRDSQPRQGAGNSLLLEANRGHLLFQDLRYGSYGGDWTISYRVTNRAAGEDPGVYGVWERAETGRRVGYHRGFRWAGAGYHSREYLSQTSHIVALPFWMICLVLSVIPTIGGVKAVRRRRQPGKCRVCGYDLRATPDRCPECGAVWESDARTVA
jgi:hypothetical protein